MEQRISYFISAEITKWRLVSMTATNRQRERTCALFLCYVTVVWALRHSAPGPAPSSQACGVVFVFGQTMSDADDELTPKRHKGLPVDPPGSQSRQHKLSLIFYSLCLSPSASFSPHSVCLSFVYLTLFFICHVCCICHARL